MKPATIARRARAYCEVCGIKAVPTDANDVSEIGKCRNCGALAEDWAFLNDLNELPPEQPLTLRCSARCAGQLEFAAQKLQPRIGAAGNGPGGYFIRYRSVNGRCGVCKTYRFWPELLRSNRDALLALRP